MHNDQINNWAERLALHRFGVIAEATNERLSHQERGALVRLIATKSHAHHRFATGSPIGYAQLNNQPASDDAPTSKDNGGDQ